MSYVNQIKKELLTYQDKHKIKEYLRFFKTAKGEYGEGDQFLGISMPNQRKVVQKYYKMVSFDDISIFLNSSFHEHRMVGLLFLVYKFQKTDEDKKNKENKENIYHFYLKHLTAVNNWDLVDVTTPKIIGAYLFDKDKSILYTFAKSTNIWKRRIAVLATFWFISKNDFQDSIKIAKILVNDSHDLIHKAVGWMLREIGKKDQQVLETFLKTHYKEMPRTMLRYSIERFEEKKRKKYLRGEI